VWSVQLLLSLLFPSFGAAVASAKKEWRRVQWRARASEATWEAHVVVLPEQFLQII
jgi:hypothetical protein